MKLYHTSPEEINKISKNGLFDDCLFFSGTPYGLGDIKAVYEIDINEKNIIDAYQLDSEEIVSHIASVLECSEEEAEKMLDGSIEAHDVTNDCEDSWFIQAQQGACAKEMGYEAVRALDEQGAVYIVPMFGREKDLIIVDDF